MLSEQIKIFSGWFFAILVFVWMVLSRRMLAWFGAAVVSAYLARWGAAFSTSRRAGDLIKDLSKRAVFITGCDSGFGLRLAERLNSMGVIVYAGVLADKSEGAEKLRALGCGVVQVDVSKDAYVLKAAEFVAEDLGETKLHAIVNNAGVAEFSEVEWCSIDTYQKLLQVNTLGTVRVTQAFLPLLRKTRGSRIVIVASVAGRYTLPGFSAYSMTKHALISFADALRKEMIPWKISVHTIQPTSYETPLAAKERMRASIQSHWDSTNPEVKKAYGENYFQTFKSNYLMGAKALTRKNPNEVVDDMVDALLNKHPQTNYLPTILTKFFVHLMTLVPTWLQDKILSRRILPDVPPAGLAGTEIVDYMQETETQ